MFDANSRLIDLKGKSYLQVMWRLVWFREDHPDWNIDTKLEHYDPTGNHAIFSAKIYDENGAQKSSGYGSESATDFRDFIEKAETKAVGRALAMLGYGTQFAPELDEGDRIVVSSGVRVSCSTTSSVWIWVSTTHTRALTLQVVPTSRLMVVAQLGTSVFHRLRPSRTTLWMARTTQTHRVL